MQNMLLVRLCADACGAVADHDAFCAEGKIVHATHSDSTGIYVDGLRSMLDALQLRLLERGKRFNKLGRQKRVHLRETWSGERSAELASTSETRNPKPTLKTYLPQDRSKPETRNRLLKLVSNCKTRNPKPTAKVGFNRRNPKPKPETRNRQRKLVSIDKTRNRNPKPTRIRLLGGSPDRNSFAFQFCLHCCIHWYSHILTPTAFFERCSVKIAFL